MIWQHTIMDDKNIYIKMYSTQNDSPRDVSIAIQQWSILTTWPTPEPVEFLWSKGTHPLWFTPFVNRLVRPTIQLSTYTCDSSIYFNLPLSPLHTQFIVSQYSPYLHISKLWLLHNTDYFLKHFSYKLGAWYIYTLKNAMVETCL